MLFSTCTFPLKTIDPVSRPGLETTCRKIIFFFFILALYSSKWFVFFFLFLFLSLWHFSFFFYVNWFYLSADLFPDFLISSSSSNFFFFFRTQVPEKSVCLHAAFRQSLSFFFLLAAAGSLDKEEQSKPLICLRKKKKKKNLKLSRRPNDDIEGQRKNFWKVFFFFFFWLVGGSQLTESFVPRPTHRGTVCLAHLAFTWTYQANGPTFYECTSSYGFSLLHRVIRHDSLSLLSTYS